MSWLDYEGLSYYSEQLLPTIDGKAVEKNYSATLMASGWSSTVPYTQTVTVLGLAADDKPILDVDTSGATTATALANLNAAWLNTIKAVASNGLLTVTVSSAPTIDLPIKIKVFHGTNTGGASSDEEFMEAVQGALEELDNNKLNTASIVDNLTSDDANKPLSAKQGKVLKELIDVIPVADGAGAHNAIYRGASLGTSVTAEQWAAIGNGTFTGLYIGDYWTIGSIVYRIAAFDYYYNTGDTACTTHHVVIVPDANMYNHPMNDSNVTTGAYIGSKMYKEGLDTAKTTINSAFGSTHILLHRAFLQNATSNGYASAGSWYDSTVELMTEQNVYGCRVLGNCINGTAFPSNYTVDKSQYPLFTHRPDMISNRQWYWMRDVASAAGFCGVRGSGYAGNNDASYAGGVRPAFCIKA